MVKEKHIPIIELNTFSSRTYVLPKTILADRRYVNESNEKFLSLNKQNLAYLNINAHIENDRIVFESNELIGAIPLRFPDNGSGKYLTDLVIKPRYQPKNSFENNWFNWVAQLANFSNYDLTIERDNQLPLTRLSGTKSPRYLLAQKVILSFYDVMMGHSWRKFDNFRKTKSRPIGNVYWDSYARNSFNPQRRLEFETSVNSISENHEDFRRALLILNEAVDEIHSARTPTNIRIDTQRIISKIKKNVTFSPLPSTPQTQREFATLPSDSHNLKLLKDSLNAFLADKREDNYSWRIDFSKLFEKYVQQIIWKIADSTENNQRIGNNYSANYPRRISLLLPKYLEPDIIARLGNTQIIVDSKYKSYYYPRQGETIDSQRERMRADIHQIIAYTRLIDSEIALLIAPSPDNLSMELVNYSKISIGIVGLPIDVMRANYNTQRIAEFVKDIISSQNN